MTPNWPSPAQLVALGRKRKISVAPGEEEKYKGWIREDLVDLGFNSSEAEVQKRFDELLSHEHYWDCKCEWCR